jgi:hypothetical protein
MNSGNESGTVGNSTQVGLAVVATILICVSVAAGLAFEQTQRASSNLDFQGHYNKPLGGSYRIIRTSSSEVIILRRGPSDAAERFIVDPTMGTIVGGNIKQLAVNLPHIIGYAEALADFENSEERAGYFILNADNDELKDGLSEDAWKLELSRINWSAPKLQKPL